MCIQMYVACRDIFTGMQVYSLAWVTHWPTLLESPSTPVQARFLHSAVPWQQTAKVSLSNQKRVHITIAFVHVHAVARNSNCAHTHASQYTQNSVNACIGYILSMHSEAEDGSNVGGWTHIVMMTIDCGWMQACIDGDY